MASELQHIDDFFRKKNDVFSADVSSADLHWQQMNEVLSQPVSLPAKKPVTSALKPLLKYAAIVTFVSTLVYIATTKSAKVKTKPSTASVLNSKKPTPEKSNSTTIASAAIRPPAHVPLVKRTAKPSTSKPVKVVLPAINYPPTPGVSETSTERENAAVFNSFYNELKKPAEKFTIDADKDTTIYCKEGSTLFIPASCFQSLSGVAIKGMVNIFVQEFYSMADIVGNKLTTQSDGQPLITGGMLNIRASAQEQEIMLRPGSAINLTMPTKIFDPTMQLFTATTNMPVDSVTTPAKTIARTNTRVGSGSINWFAAGQKQFFMNENKKYITILNLTDNPYGVVTRGNKTIGKFQIPFDCKFSTDEMKRELEKRYGRYYDKIKVRREWKPLFKKQRELNKERVEDWYETIYVGDSISIPLWIARVRKLVTREDSLAYEAKWRSEYEEAVKRNESYSEFVKIKDKYDFNITGLGWVNCDKFGKYPASALADFAVSTGDEFKELYFNAILLLESENSVIQCYWNKGTIYASSYFSRLPVGETVHMVCIGAKGGKVFSSVQQFTISKNEKYTLQFKETNPEQFKNELARFGNVTRNR